MSDIDFHSKVPPTQAQFDAYHNLPIDYGEDGDQLVGWNYTKEQAFELFVQDYLDKTGDEPTFTIDSVIEGTAGWVVQPDQYEDGDFCFAMLFDSKNAIRFYKAWRLWM